MLTYKSSFQNVATDKYEVTTATMHSRCYLVLPFMVMMLLMLRQECMMTSFFVTIKNDVIMCSCVNVHLQIFLVATGKPRKWGNRNESRAT